MSCLTHDYDLDDDFDPDYKENELTIVMLTSVIVCSYISQHISNLSSGNNSCYLNFFFQRVDCKGKHCNYQDGRPTTESCQKCNDLEQCFKFTVRRIYK